MNKKENFDISAYFVVGPENTGEYPLVSLLNDVVFAGFTCIQLRSKIASAKQMIELASEAAQVIEEAGKSEDVTLLVDDRLDIVLAAIKRGIKVDGIHLGQSDIPVDVCREYLGEDAVIGLSARTHEMIDYIKTAEVGPVDYFGVGPIRETATKPDCGLDIDGRVVSKSFEDLKTIAQLSPIPVVVGGGVKLHDLPELAKTGVDGFFVVSAITEADDPRAEAVKLVESWKEHTSHLHKK